MPSIAPGPWLRLTALGAAGATLLAVISGAAGLGTAHRVLAALALPPLVALVAAARVVHPRLLAADIDRLMGKRTERRPVAAGRVAPARAIEFGLTLSALSFVVLASAVNVLTATLALVGNLFYVLVYTRWLKRSTPQNIVIGGAAGAVPPLVGWAAATGDVTLPALFLFAIVFFWTPPHFWALALLIKRDYAAARVPMLPLARGDRETARQIVWYSVVLVGVTLLPFAWRTVGVVYLTAALLLGAAFLRLAWRLRAETTHARARALFKFSLVYLALLFVLMALDPILG